jgi:hypothetical protein
MTRWFPKPRCESGASFLEIMLSDLGQAAPEHNINKSDLFTLLTVVSPSYRIDSNGNLGDCRAFWRVTNFRVSGEISDQQYAIQIRTHN